MDRVTVYPGAIPQETDILSTNKNTMIALAKLTSALLGTSTAVNGFAVTSTAPASMQVNVSAGEIYAMANVDANPYSSLPADNTHAILKQGIALDPQLLTLAAPTTNGYSVNYLIEVAYQDMDVNAVALPYYNSTNPQQPLSGPGGNGQTQYTSRRGVAVLQAKAGIAAPTGSQQTPAPDNGYVGLYVVTVTYGQTAITAANIQPFSGAPMISSLPTLSPLAANIQFVSQSQTVKLPSHGMIEFNGGTASTITLPDPTQSTPVLTYVWNGSNSSQLTLAAAAGGFFGPGVPANGQSFVIPAGYGALICSDGRNYIVLSSCYTKSPPVGDNSALIPNTVWTNTAISNALAAAISGLSMGQYATTAAVTNAIAGLNIGQYATTSALGNAVAPLAQASRIGSNAGAVLYQATATQPQSDVGKLVELSGSFTLTTPNFSSLAVGSAMEYINTGNGPVTISGNGASFFYNGASVASITLQSGQSARCVFDGTSIVVVGGFGSASIGINPYQKLPSGLILQFGAYSGSATGDTPVTFPLAFPNAILQMGTNIYCAGSGVFAGFNLPTKTGFNGNSWSSNSVRSNSSCTFWAIGN